MLRAKILQSTNADAWYADRIGEEFEVCEQSRFLPYLSVYDKDEKVKVVLNTDILFIPSHQYIEISED